MWRVWQKGKEGRALLVGKVVRRRIVAWNSWDRFSFLCEMDSSRLFSRFNSTVSSPSGERIFIRRMPDYLWSLGFSFPLSRPCRYTHSLVTVCLCTSILSSPDRSYFSKGISLLYTYCGWHSHAYIAVPFPLFHVFNFSLLSFVPFPPFYRAFQNILARNLLDLRCWGWNYRTTTFEALRANILHLLIL